MNLRCSYIFTFFFLFVLLFSGCASRYKGYGPNFSAVDKNTRKIAILKPDLYTYEVSGGGIPEFRSDWSQIGEKKLAEALQKQLGKKGFEGVVVLDSEDVSTIDTIASFVKFTAKIIQKHLYGENPFITQIDTFDYSTGSLVEYCNRFEVDAVMFLFGSDENYSSLRKEVLKRAAAVKSAKSAFWATISMILFRSGTYRTYSIPLERSFLCCVVADVQGKIIWYKKYLESDGSDMRLNADVEKIAAKIVNGFNLRKK
jgi:hypothetical protein